MRDASCACISLKLFASSRPEAFCKFEAHETLGFSLRIYSGNGALQIVVIGRDLLIDQDVS